MDDEQSQLLAAVILLSLEDFGQTRFSGRFQDLTGLIQSKVTREFDSADIDQALAVLARLGGASTSSVPANSSFVSIDRTKAEAAFIRTNNAHFNAKKVFPLLYEFTQFGEAWLWEVWDTYFPAEAPEIVDPTGQEWTEEAVARFAPAADRLVKLDHNQIAAAERPVTDLIGALENDNGEPDHPGLRERLLGQVKAGRELIRAGEFRAALFYETLVRALGELIGKYKKPAIIALANAVLGATVSLILGAS